MVVSGACSASRWTWTRDEDKVFEQALLVVPEGLPDRWHQIAGYLPGKTPEAVLEHYQRLIHDLNDIESGRIEPPGYSDCFQIPRWTRAKCEAEKKKGIPWTKREHDGLSKVLEQSTIRGCHCWCLVEGPVLDMHVN
ncbi:protein RADIALIS-like 3 isoform X2 [Diospyros lotus]|uniref:protein RADIALIS-like 3 isoform X2 n=1 Tax=Diospyros lotus TaxID=55363 RepID=UPI0022546184|nr:protein RADIALIS-like 3 isoform X2 [Diospyros lotus]